MSLKRFIKENRKAIDQAIAQSYGDNCMPTNDEQRQLWVINDSGLYQWARSEGWRG